MVVPKGVPFAQTVKSSCATVYMLFNEFKLNWPATNGFGIKIGPRGLGLAPMFPLPLYENWEKFGSKLIKIISKGSMCFAIRDFRLRLQQEMQRAQWPREQDMHRICKTLLFEISLFYHMLDLAQENASNQSRCFECDERIDIYAPHVGQHIFWCDTCKRYRADRSAHICIPQNDPNWRLKGKSQSKLEDFVQSITKHAKSKRHAVSKKSIKEDIKKFVLGCSESNIATLVEYLLNVFSFSSCLQDDENPPEMEDFLLKVVTNGEFEKFLSSKPKETDRYVIFHPYPGPRSIEERIFYHVINKTYPQVKAEQLFNEILAANRDVSSITQCYDQFDSDWTCEFVARIALTCHFPRIVIEEAILCEINQRTEHLAMAGTLSLNNIVRYPVDNPIFVWCLECCADVEDESPDAHLVPHLRTCRNNLCSRKFLRKDRADEHYQELGLSCRLWTEAPPEVLQSPTFKDFHDTETRRWGFFMTASVHPLFQDLHRIYVLHYRDFAPVPLCHESVKRQLTPYWSSCRRWFRRYIPLPTNLNALSTFANGVISLRNKAIDEFQMAYQKLIFSAMLDRDMELSAEQVVSTEIRSSPGYGQSVVLIEEVSYCLSCKNVVFDRLKHIGNHGLRCWSCAIRLRFDTTKSVCTQHGYTAHKLHEPPQPPKQHELSEAEMSSKWFLDTIKKYNGDMDLTSAAGWDPIRNRTLESISKFNKENMPYGRWQMAQTLLKASDRDIEIFSVDNLPNLAEMVMIKLMPEYLTYFMKNPKRIEDDGQSSDTKPWRDPSPPRPIASIPSERDPGRGLLGTNENRTRQNSPSFDRRRGRSTRSGGSSPSRTRSPSRNRKLETPSPARASDFLRGVEQYDGSFHHPPPEGATIDWSLQSTQHQGNWTENDYSAQYQVCPGCRKLNLGPFHEQECIPTAGGQLRGGNYRWI